MPWPLILNRAALGGPRIIPSFQPLTARRRARRLLPMIGPHLLPLLLLYGLMLPVTGMVPVLPDFITTHMESGKTDTSLTIHGL